MIGVEYSREAVEEGCKALGEWLGTLPRNRTQLAPEEPQRFCPRHGSRYVLRRGTTRCPVGRKRAVDCVR